MNKTLTSLIRLQQLTDQDEQKGHSAELRKQIDALRATLSENLLRRFDHLERHGRLPVAQVSESGACGSCHMKLPRAEALRVRRLENQLSTCPYCGCFLYAAAATVDTRESAVAV